MWAVAPQTVSSSSSKKCNGRSMRRAAPPFPPVGAGSGEFAHGRPEHPVDLTGLRCEFRTPVEDRHDRDDVTAAHDGVEMGELTDDHRHRRVESDLLVGLPERGLDRRLARIEATARES